ncbi:MAG: NlpC/P60 family protein, partial [Ginsengibacter sp.]
MKILYFLIAFSIAIFIFYLSTHKQSDSSSVKSNEQQTGSASSDTIDNTTVKQTLPKIKDTVPVIAVVTRGTLPDSLVAYAETLLGTPYKYASTDPSVGFDCSGFITYVFNHYNISVPRSSKDFENTGTEIPIK